jgi:hypothetical protein
MSSVEATNADAVERHRSAVGLREVDMRIAANVETLPVDDGALGVLGDVHARAIAGDLRLASHYSAARGQHTGCEVTCACGQCRHREQGGCNADTTRAALATRTRQFGNDNPVIELVVPDESVDLVHFQNAHSMPNHPRVLLALPSASLPLAERPGLLPILVAT